MVPRWIDLSVGEYVYAFSGIPDGEHPFFDDLLKASRTGRGEVTRAVGVCRVSFSCSPGVRTRYRRALTPNRVPAEGSPRSWVRSEHRREEHDND